MIARPPMFLLDENVPRKVLTSLRAEGYTATRVYDAGLRCALSLMLLFSLMLALIK